MRGTTFGWGETLPAWPPLMDRQGLKIYFFSEATPTQERVPSDRLDSRRRRATSDCGSPSDEGADVS